MVTTKIRRGAFHFQLYFSLFLLCAFVPLWFNTSQAQLAPATEAKIRAILDAPKFAEAHIGISILDLGTVAIPNAFPAKPPIGKPFRVIFERDAQKKFMPASNMKLFTAAIALHLLGKDKTFPTRVLHRLAWPALNSSRDVYTITGGGDPSFDQSGLNELARQIKDKGIHRLEDLQADGTAYSAETSFGRYPFGWTLDDTIWYYGPEISALAFHRNQVDVTITGGNGAKEDYGMGETPTRARAECVPSSDKIQFRLSTGTSELLAKSEEELLSFQRDSHFMLVKGQVAPNQKLSFGLAAPSVPSWIADKFAEELKRVGVASNVRIWLEPRTIDSVNDAKESVAQYNSPPLSFLFQRLLKNSDNLYAEMILRNAAYYHDGTGGDKAGPRAHALLKKWLIAQNIDTRDLRFEDGSGLSRYNLLTPRAIAELLAAINSMKDGEVIWNALPIAGIDGTLKKRMESTPAHSNAATGNVRTKTGTFSIASNLSGYVTTKNKRRLAVSLMINFARDTDSAQKMQDEIFEILAEAEL